ncbi:MarR family winged helix-turn-helix transcriptional regulator [Umezawaea sp.]|uniref:MarR family winged helix-turn-helix transcriptional regulator n=1 Tax=Umezawaea sp. TaxID=1955258 RepID=UPI002ED0A036
MTPGSQQRPAPVVEVVDLLFELTDRVKAQFAMVTGSLQLQVPQARALLRINGPVSMRDLAARLRCDASNMTGIIDGLHAGGLVERQALPNDRRVKQVVLTEEGKRLQTRLRQRLAVGVPVLGTLDDTERQELHAILLRVVERS